MISSRSTAPARTALVTGSSGFIGFHTANALLDQGWKVIGLDAMTDYYDVSLKKARLAQLEARSGFQQTCGFIETPGLVADILSEHQPNAIIHLAAQAGVRYSIEAPRSYLEANIAGTFEILEAVRANPVQHLAISTIFLRLCSASLRFMVHGAALIWRCSNL